MSQPQAELGNDGEADAMSLLLNRPEPKGREEDEAQEETEDDAPVETQGEELEEGDAPESSQDDDPEIEVEIGGKPEKVKLSELRAGYMKDADYRRKTAEVAEQRRAVEQWTRQVAQERQQAANQLDAFIGALHNELIGSQPDNRLIESDPQEFLRQQAAYNARAQQYQQALAHRQAVTQQEQAAQDRQRAEYVREQGERLIEALPAWKDDKVRVQESGEIARYLSELGYSPEELNELTDHRQLLVAREAMKFRKLQAAKGKQVPPAAGKPVKPGAARPGSSNQTRYDDALAKARKTGRPEDVVRVLMQKG